LIIKIQNDISLFPTAHSIFPSSWLNIFFVNFYQIVTFNKKSNLYCEKVGNKKLPWKKIKKKKVDFIFYIFTIVLYG